MAWPDAIPLAEQAVTGIALVLSDDPDLGALTPGAHEAMGPPPGDGTTQPPPTGEAGADAAPPNPPTGEASGSEGVPEAPLVPTDPAAPATD